MPTDWNGGEMGKETFAYTAGIIDGEGCVECRLRKEIGNRNESAYVRVRVVNTDFRLIFWLKENFGGIVSKERKMGQKQKPAMEWSLAGFKKVVPFLCCVYPFLILKKDRADIVFAFSKLIRKCNKWNPLTDKEKAIRFEFYLRMKALNRRGLQPEETERTGLSKESMRQSKLQGIKLAEEREITLPLG